MKATKNQSGKPMNEKNKREPEPIDKKLINKHADQWCRDNGYPIQKRYFVYREKDDEKN